VVPGAGPAKRGGKALFELEGANIMKRLAIAVAATVTAIAPAAFAQYDRYDRYDNRYDSRYEKRDYSGERARVLEARPLYESTAAQRQECWNSRSGHYEAVRDPDGNSNDKRNLAGTIIGGIAGGVLGHQVGSGRGNTAATVGGAALGAYAGNRIQDHRNDDNQSDLDKSNCRVVADSGSAQAFDVRYSWQGREYVARMDHDPGRFVELGRDVNPDGTPYSTVANSYSSR